MKYTVHNIVSARFLAMLGELARSIEVPGSMEKQMVKITGPREVSTFRMKYSGMREGNAVNMVVMVHTSIQ